MQYGGYEVLGRKEHQWSGNSNEKIEVPYCSSMGQRRKNNDYFRGLSRLLMGRGRSGKSKMMKGTFKDVIEILGIWLKISL